MNARFIKSATRKNQYPNQVLPAVAFAGRSNVGKSSLINSLVGKKRLARTSSTPGRTQVINFFEVDDRWLFVDLPGYGYARVPTRFRSQWGDMIEEFLRHDERLRLTLLILDARHPPTQLDQMMKSWLEEWEIPHRVVATKVDKLSGNELRNSIREIEKSINIESVIPYSSATGKGKKELWQIIKKETVYG